MLTLLQQLLDRLLRGTVIVIEYPGMLEKGMDEYINNKIVAEFDHDGVGHYLSSAGGFDAFLVSYSTFPGSYTGEIKEPVLDLNIYPNPALDNSTINFSLKEGGNCFVGIHSLNGELIKVLSKDFLTPGNYQYDIDLANMNNGTYVVSVCRGQACVVKRLMVIKP